MRGVLLSMSRYLSDILSDFPPKIVRLLARTGRGSGSRRLTHEEVAKRSGLAYQRVRVLSAMSGWSGVPIDVADAFLRGCGVSLDNLWRHRAFLRRSLDPRITRRPLAYATKLGVPTAPPDPAALVAAAMNGRRMSRRRGQA